MARTETFDAPRTESRSTLRKAVDRVMAARQREADRFIRNHMNRWSDSF
ncbi:hypothetical protein [Consotaella aegiceratis]